MKVSTLSFIALLVALSVDGVSKVWAERALIPHQPVPVIGELFRFTLGYNTGVAFGMFADGGPWPLIITGIVILGLIIWFVMTALRGQVPPLAGWGIGLLIGGAIGNFVDRYLDARVTDFLDVGIGAARWPTFNLADSFILIGLALLLLMEIRGSPKKTDVVDEHPGDVTVE